MKIMALDNASRICGIARFNDSELIESGVIISDNESDLKRLEEIYNQIKEKVIKSKPDFIVFEDTFFSKNINTLKILCRLQGLIISLCIQYDIGYYILLPSEWRKLLNFHGAKKRIEQKQKAIEYVNNKYRLGLNSKQDDIAEAICIGNAFLVMLENNLVSSKQD